MLAATGEALALLARGDPGIWEAIGTSLLAAVAALLAAAPLAIGLAYLLAATRFWGRQAVIVAMQALLAVPTVAVGLLLYLLLSRDGPLGALELLFTPEAVALGQFLIALPILAAFSHAALRGNVALVRETARSLGAGRLRAILTVIGEARAGLLGAVAAGFGRIISEVGCALMVGGNIAGSTRTIPTAIALETGRGKFAEGIALGIVLLLLAAVASILLAMLQRKQGAEA